jgi:hypothetical protein
VVGGVTGVVVAAGVATADGSAGGEVGGGEVGGTIGAPTGSVGNRLGVSRVSRDSKYRRNFMGRVLPFFEGVKEKGEGGVTTGSEFMCSGIPCQAIQSKSVSHS